MAYKRRRMPRKAYKNANRAAAYGYGAYKAIKYGSKALPIVANAVKYIGGLVNVEKHQKLTSVTGSTTNAGTVNLISGIAQGDDIGNRQGNSVKSVDLMCNYTLNQSGTTDNFLRIIIFMDTANQGSSPAVTDLLNTAVPTAQRNIDNMKRFKIFHDKLISFDANYSTRAYKYYKKLGMHLRFSGSADTNVLQNAIYCLLVDSNSTDHCDVNMQFKISFYDN